MSSLSDTARMARHCKALVTGTRGEPALGEPLRLLLADDCEASRLLHLALLDGLGYAADAVANGEEVLRALAARDYDVVMLDIDMPVLGGIRAARWIRQLAPARPLFLVAVTAGTGSCDRAACESAGFDAYIAKPASTDKFLAILEQACSRLPARLLEAPVEQTSGPSDAGNSAQQQDTLADIVFRRVVPIYLRELPARTRALRAAFAAHDADELARVCHALKGASRIIDAPTLAAACEQMEQRAYNGDIPDAGTLDALIELAAAVATDLGRRLAGERTAPSLKLVKPQ